MSNRVACKLRCRVAVTFERKIANKYVKGGLHVFESGSIFVTRRTKEEASIYYFLSKRERMQIYIRIIKKVELKINA